MLAMLLYCISIHFVCLQIFMSILRKELINFWNRRLEFEAANNKYNICEEGNWHSSQEYSVNSI